MTAFHRSAAAGILRRMGFAATATLLLASLSIAMADEFEDCTDRCDSEQAACESKCNGNAVCRGECRTRSAECYRKCESVHVDSRREFPPDGGPVTISVINQSTDSVQVTFRDAHNLCKSRGTWTETMEPNTPVEMMACFGATYRRVYVEFFSDASSKWQPMMCRGLGGSGPLAFMCYEKFAEYAKPSPTPPAAPEPTTKIEISVRNGGSFGHNVDFRDELCPSRSWSLTMAAQSSHMVEICASDVGRGRFRYRERGAATWNVSPPMSAGETHDLFL